MQQIKITPTVTDRTAAVSRYMSDVNRYPMVTPKEEEELAFRIRAGDEEALRRLVEANLRFVISVAKQYQGHGMDLPDLINEGNVGLLKAARKFDPSKGFKFISYAVWWIRQSILQALADKSRMVRLPINQVNALGKMLKAGAVFLQENGREPSDAEIADLTGLSPDKTGDAARVSGPLLSFDTPFGEGGEGTLLDVVPDGSCPSAEGTRPPGTGGTPSLLRAWMRREDARGNRKGSEPQPGKGEAAKGEGHPEDGAASRPFTPRAIPLEKRRRNTPNQFIQIRKNVRTSQASGNPAHRRRKRQEPRRRCHRGIPRQRASWTNGISLYLFCRP